MKPNRNQPGWEKRVPSSDEATFAQAQAGDPDAFGVLVRRYQHQVYAIALRILHQPHDAQDAAQQAFLHAWQKRRTYDPRWRFRTWLYRIVTNVCIDEYRRQQRRQQAARLLPSTAGRAPSPAQSYERSESRQALATALAQLPLQARIVFVLCYVDGLSYADVAHIRGISVQTVKSQLRRAKALLRRHLGPYCEETP